MSCLNKYLLEFLWDIFIHLPFEFKIVVIAAYWSTKYENIYKDIYKDINKVGNLRSFQALLVFAPDMFADNFFLFFSWKITNNFLRFKYKAQ